MFRRTILVLGVVLVGIALERPSSSPPGGPSDTDPGSLVRTTAQSTVGVLLDEIPSAMRARVAGALMAKPPAFWRDRAMQQLRPAAP